MTSKKNVQSSCKANLNFFTLYQTRAWKLILVFQRLYTQRKSADLQYPVSLRQSEELVDEESKGVKLICLNLLSFVGVKLSSFVF
jgi:hypothetical protein